MRPFDSAANHYGSFVRILALYRLASTGSKFAGLLWIFVGDNPKKNGTWIICRFATGPIL